MAVLRGPAVLTLALVASACFREAYPCDEGTALALASECAAKYQTCRDAGHPDACPEADACDDKALERDHYCVERIRSGK